MTSPINLHRHALSILLGGSILASSAQIPNAGFENWTDQDTYTEPTDWLTYNEVPTVAGATVEQGTPGNPGNFHAVITTRQSTGGSFDIQGWISAGNSSGAAGFSCVQRPGSLTGQWQYAVQAGDTAQALVAFSKWNGSAAVPLGIGTLEVTGTISSWQAFNVPITWLTGDMPDTAYIQIVSSINFDAPVVGSTMKVDDLAFSGSAGIDEQAVQQPVFIMHSLAEDVLQITSSETGGLQFYDAGGRLVMTRSIQGLNTTLSISSLPKGMVLYRFIGCDGLVTSGKWTGL
jgi:hypothetical protein